MDQEKIINACNRVGDVARHEDLTNEEAEIVFMNSLFRLYFTNRVPKENFKADLIEKAYALFYENNFYLVEQELAKGVLRTEVSQEITEEEKEIITNSNHKKRKKNK